MKYLNWFKANLNLVSFVVGLSFIAFGRDEVGRVIINHGSGL